MRCANAGCEAAEAAGGEWRKGWALRSGGFATLCDKCGMAYEQLVFCDQFHQNESGWRECIFCGKRLHCGCIASTSSVYLLDGGGVQCRECMKNSGPSLLPTECTGPLLQRPQVALALSAVNSKVEKANDFGTSVAASACELRSIPADCTVDGASAAAADNIVQLGINTEANTHKDMLQEKRESYNLSGSFARDKGEQVSFIQSANFSSRVQGSTVFSLSRRNDNKNDSKDIIICDSLAHPYRNVSSWNSNPDPPLAPILSSSIQHTVSSWNSNPDPPLAPILSSSIQHTVLPLPHTFEEGRDHNRTLSSSQQVQRACHMLPKAQKSGHFASSEASNEVVSHTRVARPPGEGRGRSQLLPRYWPRITEQELKQISGDSNSTIVPLFEKVLSVSDAGRIGRLVLPKACAEAYFPPISQPEGLPLKIQDARGKEWLFQFRFWPNNNSRMYVLEGVTPCIQSLQLQAGDTVTFSRIDPEGKLIMGFRKATNSVPLQDSQISAIVNGAIGTEAFFSGVNENLPIISGYSGLLQSLKGAADPNLSCLSEQLNLADGGISWQRTGKHAGKQNEELGLHPLLGIEKKKSRNIGSKSKRLHMDNEDALELKLTWEEAQNLLRSPTSIKPSIVMIENYEFEEYEEPPVFGKGTIFTVRTSGAQDQWIQCDDCFKLRRLPVDVLLPSKWKCSDNIWDPQRSSCSIPDELSSKDLQNLFQQNADMRRQNASSSGQYHHDAEAPGLDPALGDENQTTTSTATTTKHPRHRPGCTCIVCIQPPSGKGPKHDPACSCNVCLTVKRRFKTLMMRKKKRQFEREEAESAAHKTAQLPASNQSGAVVAESLEPGMGRIDLNYRPACTMVGLVRVASQPLEMYLKQNGLTSLACEQQASESEGQTTDELDEGCCGPDFIPTTDDAT